MSPVQDPLRRLVLGGGVALGAGAAWPLAAGAQTAPAAGAAAGGERTVRIVVPFPPGALTDSLGRAVADRLRTGLGLNVVVENRPGAGTLVGAAAVAKAPPDGQTLLIATSTTLGISPALFTRPAATAKDFTGVAMLGTVQFFLVANPAFPANTPAELVGALRAKPGGYTYASPGNGTVHHLLVEMLKTREKVEATHVPYQGSVQAITDVIAGRIDFMFVDATVALPQIRAGRVKAIAVNGSRRSSQMPSLPAITETWPALDLQAWQSVAAPVGTPADVVARYHGEINRALSTPEFRAQLEQMGVEATPMSVAEFNELIRRDGVRWAELVKASGAKVD